MANILDKTLATTVDQTDTMMYVGVNIATTPVDRRITPGNFHKARTGNENVLTYASLAAAVTAIGSSVATIEIPATTAVTADLAVPSNITLQFTGAGQVSVSSGKVLTINGPLQAGLRQVFAGNGSVAGLSESRPEWFGAKRDGVVVTDGAMSSVSNQTRVTCSTSTPFSSADVGKLIDVNQAGASSGGYFNNLTGTISAYTSASQITASFSALHTVSDAQVIYGSDDTAAIQKAIAAASSYGQVIFSSGIYMVTAQLSPLSNQTWSGAGKGVSVLYMMGVLRNSSATSFNAINVVDTTHDVTLKDFSVRGTNLLGASVVGGGAVAFGIRLGTGSGGAIYNVTIQDVETSYVFGMGMRSDGDVGDQAGSAATVINIRILNCDATHNSDNGININTGGGMEVSGCRLTDNGAGGLEFSGSRTNIHHCYIARNRSVGVGFGGLGNPSRGVDCLISHSLIERNGSGATGSGIQVGGNVTHAILGPGLIIRENELNGIGINDGTPDFSNLSRDIRVTNSIICSNGNGGGGVGISLSMDDVVIESCDIFDDGVAGYAQAVGIQVHNDGAKLLHNRARNNTGYDYQFILSTNSLLVKDGPVGTIDQYEGNGYSGTVDTSGTSVSFKTGYLFNSRWVGVPIKINGVTYVISAVAAAPSGNFTVSGLTVTRTSGTNFDSAWVGKYIRLGPSLYFPIASVGGTSTLTITNPIGNTVPASGAWVLNGSVSATLSTSAGSQTGVDWVIPPPIIYPSNNAVQQNVTFIATPVFDANQANVFRITLTGNVTSSQLVNGVDGQTVTFIIIQDSTGSRTFAWPGGVYGTTAIGSTADKFNVQSFVRLAGNWFAVAAGVINQA